MRNDDDERALTSKRRGLLSRPFDAAEADVVSGALRFPLASVARHVTHTVAPADQGNPAALVRRSVHGRRRRDIGLWSNTDQISDPDGTWLRFAADFGAALACILPNLAR
jgi:hypothetical protein